MDTRSWYVLCEPYMKLVQNATRMRLMETSCRLIYLPLPDCRVVIITIFAATFAKR